MSNDSDHVVGRHALVPLDLSGGVHDGTMHEGGIILAKQSTCFIKRGRYESESALFDFPANEMVLTWNATSPPGAEIGVEFAVRSSGGQWSAWFQMGSWKSDVSRRLRRDDPAFGRLDVDHFKASVPFERVRFRAAFRTSDPSQSPLLRRVTLCVSDTSGEGAAEPLLPSGVASDLDVPWLSQHDEDTVKDRVMIDAGVCAATSVTMVLNYYGVPANVRDVGRRAWDPSAGIYGNWAFLVAAASEYGPDAWVERFSDLRHLEALIEKGTPPVVSISYNKGDVSAGPERETSGHLIVVRGFTSDGDVIVNDPDATSESGGRACVYARAEFARAFFNHGGVGIIIKK